MPPLAFTVYSCLSLTLSSEFHFPPQPESPLWNSTPRSTILACLWWMAAPQVLSACPSSPAIKTLGMTNIFLSPPRPPPTSTPCPPCHPSTLRPPPLQPSAPSPFSPSLPPTLFSHFNCPENPTIHLVEKKHHLFCTSQIIYFFSPSLSLSFLFSFSPPFYRNSPFPYKMKIHLELHLMSSLCLLSVDDVYEELRRAAECLMMHKIKPSLSAVLRLPSASQAADTRWGNRLQTAIRWTGEKGKPTSSLCVSRDGGKVRSWCTRLADRGGSESWQRLQRMNRSVSDCWVQSKWISEILSAHSNYCRHFPVTSNVAQLQKNVISPFLLSDILLLLIWAHTHKHTHTQTHNQQICSWPPSSLAAEAPAVYDKNIILLVLNNPINLSTGKNLTSPLLWCWLPDHVMAATVNSNH